MNFSEGIRSFAEIPRARQASRALAFVPESILARTGGLARLAGTGNPGRVAPQTRWGKLGDVLATQGELVAPIPDRLCPLHEGLRQSNWSVTIQPRLSCTACRNRGRESCGTSSRVKRYFIRYRSWSWRISSANDCFVIRTRQAWRYRWKYACLCWITRSSRRSPASIRSNASFRFKARNCFGILRLVAWTRNYSTDQNGALSCRSARGAGRHCVPTSMRHLRIGITVDRLAWTRDVVARLWAAFKSGARGIYWSRIWAIFVLLRWCRAHGVAR